MALYGFKCADFSWTKIQKWSQICHKISTLIDQKCSFNIFYPINFYSTIQRFLIFEYEAPSLRYSWQSTFMLIRSILLVPYFLFFSIFFEFFRMYFYSCYILWILPIGGFCPLEILLQIIPSTYEYEVICFTFEVNLIRFSNTNGQSVNPSVWSLGLS